MVTRLLNFFGEEHYMYRLKFVLPSLILMGGLTLFSTASFGKAEYTKATGKTCTYCHIKAGAKDLNDMGKCYAKKHTLEGCETK
ncbi:MAG: hypothetical protein ABSG25_04035 [Bryobacteraceae bacterium]